MFWKVEFFLRCSVLYKAVSVSFQVLAMAFFKKQILLWTSYKATQLSLALHLALSWNVFYLFIVWKISAKLCSNLNNIQRSCKQKLFNVEHESSFQKVLWMTSFLNITIKQRSPMPGMVLLRIVKRTNLSSFSLKEIGECDFVSRVSKVGFLHTSVTKYTQTLHLKECQNRIF